MTDSESPRDGRYLEVIGYYNPKKGRASATVKKERLLYWLSKGAKPSATVRSIMKEVQAGSSK